MGQPITTSIKKIWGMELALNKDLFTTPPKPNIKNLVTHFVNPKPKMSKVVPCPPSNDGIGIDGFSLEKKCKKTLNEIENNEN